MTSLNRIDLSFHFNFFKLREKLAIESVKLSKLYKVNHVEVNMNNMYKLLCINYNDHHEKFSNVHSVMSTKFWKSVYARLCSSTAATSRKQVTNCFYFVISNLVLIPQFLSDLNESCYTKQCVYVSNVSEQPYLEETELMTEVLQKLCDGENRRTLKESISANQCCLQ